MSAFATWPAVIATLPPLVGVASGIAGRATDRTRIKLNLEIAALLRVRNLKYADTLEQEAILDMAATQGVTEWITLAITVTVSIPLCTYLWSAGLRQLAAVAFFAAMAASRITWMAIKIRRAEFKAGIEAKIESAKSAPQNGVDQ